MGGVPRVWSWALRLLPRRFRERHAEEMTEVLLAHLEGRGRWGRIAVQSRALADLVWAALRYRMKGKGAGMDGWSSDFRYAARTLSRRPGYTAVAALTLALGTGVATAVGSLVHRVVLAPSPYEDPDRIVQIALDQEGRRTVMLPRRAARALLDAAPEYLSLGVASFRDVALGSSGAPERVRGTVVTGSTLSFLGVDPILGRLPDPSDDAPDGPCVTVLSHELWNRVFGGSPDVVGEFARLDGAPCVVLGVMPEGFAYPAPYYAPGDLWLLAGPTGVDWSSWDDWFMVFGRIGPGVDRATVRARLQAIPAAEGTGGHFTTMRWAGYIRADARQRLLILLAAAMFVLVIACVNLVTLQIGRTVDRREEVATRIALGASRGRLLRLLAAEAGLITLLGAAGGLLAAMLSVDLIVALRSFHIPRMEEVSIDGTAVLICVALAALVGLVSAGVPALALGRPAAGSELRRGRGLTTGLRRRRFGRLLVTVETALAIVLLSGAALLLRSYDALTDLDPGFRSAGVLHARVTPPPSRYPDGASLSAFFREAEERIRALPGVVDLAVTQVPPGVGAGAGRAFEIVGRPSGTADPLRTAWRSVSPSYFRTLDIPLLRGGGLDEHRDGPHAVVVNETFVRRFFPGGEALGETIRPLSGAGTDAVWRIVGVVGDVHEEFVHSPVPPTVYVRYDDAPGRSMVFLARGTGEPTALAQPIRRTVATIDPDLPLFAVRDLDFLLSGEHDLNRLGMVLLALFAGAALLLAVAGIYGVVAHAVGRRLQEMGIRIALGALGRNVILLVVRDSFRFAVLGGALGVGVTFLLGDRLRALTPEWVGLAPGVVAGAALAVILVAVLAAWIPARRAASADPVSALQTE